MNDIKKLFYDNARNDVASENIPESLICGDDDAVAKYKEQRIHDLYFHGEKLRGMYGKQSMDQVLNMFETQPFIKLPVALKAYISGVDELLKLDRQRKEYLLKQDIQSPHLQ